MQLGTFAPRTNDENYGDRLTATDAVDRALVIVVREHRTGIKTKYNSDPTKPAAYKPEGSDGVTVDVADVKTNEVWIDVLWLNGAVVDNLAPYVGQTVPIKLVWTASAKGGAAYIGVAPLEGQELALAQQWALTNPQRFDTERTQRAATAAQEAAAVAAAPPASPSALGALATQQGATPPQPPTPVTDPTQDPQVLALIAQLQAQQNKAS